MNPITRDDVTNAITEFLSNERQAKLEPEQKKLDKLEPGSAEAQTIEETIASLRTKYSASNWLKQAATTMARQLKFGSHISKGIHPDSKGDNINFRSTRELPAGLVGSQQLTTTELDANGNAAALPLAAFFNISVNNTKLRELILAQHPAIEGAFASSPEVSAQYQQAFKQALDGTTDNPTTSGRNKQLLWPLDDAIETDNYRCLLPLHPSALVYEVSQTINELRFSEQNKSAKDNRRKDNIEQQAYLSFVALANQQLGGTKPQNVSSLTSKQGGRMLLLESLPPTYTRQHEFTLGKQQENFFSKPLARHCNEGLRMLYGVVEEAKNTLEQRQQRKRALDLILGQVLQAAAYVQQHYPPGWSASHPLKMQQKYWLDPRRAEQPEQEDFNTARINTDWVPELMNDFSLWLNSLLRQQFKQQATAFNDDHHLEWLRTMEAAIKASQRAREGIF